MSWMNDSLVAALDRQRDQDAGSPRQHTTTCPDCGASWTHHSEVMGERASSDGYGHRSILNEWVEGTPCSCAADKKAAQEEAEYAARMAAYAADDAAKLAAWAALPACRPDDQRVIECYLPGDNIGEDPRRLTVAEYLRHVPEAKYAVNHERAVARPGVAGSQGGWVWLFAADIDREQAVEEAEAAARNAAKAAAWASCRPVKTGQFAQEIRRGKVVLRRLTTAEAASLRLRSDGILVDAAGRESGLNMPGKNEGEKK